MTLVSLVAYGKPFQRKVLGALLTDKKFVLTVRDVLKEEYWDGQADRWIVNQVLKYWDEYRCTITLEVLKIELQKVENETLKIAIREELRHSYEASQEDLEYVEGEFAEFCRNQEMKTAILNSTDLLKVNDFEGIVMPGCFTDGSEKDSSSETDAGVLTEATADLGGLAVSLDIGAALEGSNFDYEAFFIRGAKNFSDYCSRYVYSAYGLDTDEHPVGKIRVNQGYEAFDVFNDTYGIASGDAMYVDDNDY